MYLNCAIFSKFRHYYLFLLLIFLFFFRHFLSASLIFALQGKKYSNSEITKRLCDEMTQKTGGCGLPSFAQVKAMHIMNVFDELMTDLKDNPAHMIEAFQQIQNHCQRSSVLFSCPSLIASYTSHRPKSDEQEIRDSFRSLLDFSSLPVNPQRNTKQIASSDFRNEFSATKTLNGNNTAEVACSDIHNVTPYRMDPVSSSFMVESCRKAPIFPLPCQVRNIMNSSGPPFRSKSALPLSISTFQCKKNEENGCIDAAIQSRGGYNSFSSPRNGNNLDTRKKGDKEQKLHGIIDNKGIISDAGIGVKETEYKGNPSVQVSSLTKAGFTADKEGGRTYSSSHRNNCSTSTERIPQSERYEISSTLHASPTPVVRGSSKYEGFWIVVWPCFGTTTSSFSHAGKRVFVRARYRLIVDVTEEVAKELRCQPPASVLYEPDGKEIQSIKLLRPEGHYLLFPSGGFYRRTAVPEALLHTLLRSAKMACSA